MMMTKLPFPTAAMLLALSSFSQAAITSYSSDFNSGSGSLSEFFHRTGDNEATGLTWNATAGVGGGAGVLVTTGATADNFFYRPGVTPENATSAFDFSALGTGQGFSSSVDFLWSNSTSTELTSVNAGFSTHRGSSALSAGSQTTSFISGSLIRNGASSVDLRIRSHTGVAFSSTLNQNTLDAGAWYRLTYQATLNSDGTIANLVTLYSIGANGLATPVVVDSISGNVTNDMVADSTTMYSAYDIRNTNSNGIDAVDNLNVTFIPEPSAMALLALGGVALAGRRRRC